MGGVCSSDQSVAARDPDAATEKKRPSKSSKKLKKQSKDGGAGDRVAVADAHIAVVRDLWQRLKPREQQIGARMYKMFFHNNPEYRQYFEDTQFKMPGRLMTMFERLLDQGTAEGMQTQFAHLGRVHHERHVPLEAFPRFIDAMLRAIQEDFKKHKLDLSDKERESYFRVCDLISKEIIGHMKALEKADSPAKAKAAADEGAGEGVPGKAAGESNGGITSVTVTGSASSIFETEAKDGGMSNEKAVEIFQRVWSEKIDEATQLEIGRRFYTIFLTSNPKYRTMFGGSVDKQAAVFMRMLGMFSEQGVEKFAQNYERIISRHRQRGLDRQAFVKFGKAMIVAMKDVLSSKPGGFSSTEVEAMRQVYTMLSTPMVKAIENAQQKPLRTSTKPNASPMMTSATIPEHNTPSSASATPGTMPTAITALPPPGPGSGPQGLTPEVADVMHRARRGSGSGAAALALPRSDSFSASANSRSRSFLRPAEIGTATQAHAEMYRRSLSDPYFDTMMSRGGGTGLARGPSGRYLKYSSGSGTLPRSISRNRNAGRTKSELLSTLRPINGMSSSSSTRLRRHWSVGSLSGAASVAPSLSSTQSMSMFASRSRGELKRRQPHRSTSFQGVPTGGGGGANAAAGTLASASASYQPLRFSASNRVSAAAQRSGGGSMGAAPKLLAERSRESLRSYSTKI